MAAGGVVRVGNAAKIKAVAIALRHLGSDRVIVNEMAKTIRRLATPVRRAIRASAVAVLPRRGGLGTWVAQAAIRVSVTRSQRRAGITIVVGKNSAHGRTDIRGIDRGRTRAPLWGNRKWWYPHQVTPGYATRVVDTEVFDEFRADATQAVDTAVERVLHVL